MFLIVFLSYYLLLLVVSYVSGRLVKGGKSEFYSGTRHSPWWLVAIGMVGSSISGVSLVSVPGMVRDSAFAYMQMVLGFFFGYLIIAYVLLPIYYRYRLTSIYSYLGERLGDASHRTASAFFIVSKMMGAAVRFYVVALILHQLVLVRYGVPFPLTVAGLALMMWLYTRRSGIKSIIYTDALQTVCLVLCVVAMCGYVMRDMAVLPNQAWRMMQAEGLTQCFNFDDWHAGAYFWKMFVSGIFIPVVMTGLDQDMMQKNLTCSNLAQAQKNMITYGICFVPVNALLLFLGGLLMIFAQNNGIALPARSDVILPTLASAHLGTAVALLFMVGLVAAAFSSADSALTSLTTTIVLDQIRPDEHHEARTRKITHIAVTVVFCLVICAIDIFNSTTLLDAVYTIASYTYGPLLGLFCLALFTNRRPVNNAAVPFVCAAAPVLCWGLKLIAKTSGGYEFGYELLLINAFFTFLPLFVMSKVEK